MAPTPVAGRVIFQRFHLFINKNPDQDVATIKFDTDPHYHVLGKEYDARSPEQQEALAQQCRLTLAAFAGFESMRKDLDRNAELLDRLELKGFPGGAKQQAFELDQFKKLVNKFETLLSRFKAHVDLMVKVHREVGSSRYCIDSVKKLQDLVVQKIGETTRMAGEIAEKIASVGDQGPYNPAEEEMRRQIEALQGDRLDYFPPLLSSSARWLYAREFGQFMGLASLWVRLDDNDIVRDRVVRKDTRFSAGDLFNPKLWVPDPQNAKRKLPMEFHCQRRAQMPREATNIVGARKAEVDEEQLVSRLYTDFCPHGDVAGLIGANTMELQKFPEAWVWMAFSALVDCGLIMERGYVADFPEEQRDWVQIIHRDLKPHNIFLDLAREDSWPRYPQAKVGDFGLSIETWPEDPRNPQYWGNAGTVGWRAPEQVRLGGKPPKGPSVQLLAHTNVWGVGKIISDIVNRTSAVVSQEDPTYLSNGDCYVKWRDEVGKRFSPDLLTTVKDCLRYDPKMRPTFAELRKRIDFAMSLPLEEPLDTDISLQACMYDARIGIQSDFEQHRLHCLPDEKYKVNMAFQNLKAGPGHGVPSAGPGASWGSDSR